MLQASTSMLPIISFVISATALGLSVLAVWKTHLAPFHPLTTVGSPIMRCYPLGDETERWFIISFGIPISILNTGAQPGTVAAMRLRLHFPDFAAKDNYELVEASFEVDPAEAWRIGPDRGLWIDKLVLGNCMPILIAAKATAVRHILFETRWDKPLVQENFVAELQFKIGTWRQIATWAGSLDSVFVWPQMLYGSSFTLTPTKAGQSEQQPEWHPPDLHARLESTESFEQIIVEREGILNARRSANNLSPEEHKAG